MKEQGRVAGAVLADMYKSDRDWSSYIPHHTNQLASDIKKGKLFQLLFQLIEIKDSGKKELD